MSLLFTTSEHFTSRLVRAVTGEDCSHCAIRWDNLVVHSNWKGVNIVFWDEFRADNKVVHEIPLEDNEANRTKMTTAIVSKDRSPYDTGAFLFLGISLYLRAKWGVPLPKSNLWNSTGMYLCTEWVTSVLGEEDSMITPCGLYNKLTSTPSHKGV